MDRIEPRSANDYDDRTTTAVERVLVEIGQIRGSFEGKFAVIGGRAVAAGAGGDASWPGSEHTQPRLEEAVDRHYRHAPPLTP